MGLIQVDSMENASANYLIPIILLFIFCTSCVASREPRIKERIVSLKQEVIQPHVEVHLKNSKILFSKKAVIKILDKELRTNLQKEVRSNKEKLKHFLTGAADHCVISSLNQVNELDDMITIIAKLLKSGNAVVFDVEGSKANKIKVKEEYLLFGSYQKSFVLLDGREVIVTSVKFGE